MNIFKKTLTVTVFALTVPVTAQAFETSGNMTLTTDYKFRGISQSDTGPAVQGGFDVSFENGIYIGTWGSTVDFKLTGDANPSMELDYYAGYGGSISEDISYDVGAVYYDYPTASPTNFSSGAYDKDRDLDYSEIYGSLGYKDFTLGYAYSSDYWQETGKFNYIYADYSYALPADFALDFHAGLNDFDNASDDGNLNDSMEAFLSDGEDSYTDYSITISKSFYGLDVALSFIDTDLDRKECWGSDWCESSAVFSISKSM